MLENLLMKNFFYNIIADTSRAGDKYETISTNNGYSKFMKLKIRNITQQDFGSYRCVAKNSLGETDGYIKLDGNLSSLFTSQESYGFSLNFLFFLRLPQKFPPQPQLPQPRAT